MNATIIQLEPDDWQRYRDIRLRALETDPQAFFSTAEDSRKFNEKEWRRRLSAEDAGTFVLQGADGNDQGLVGALPYREDDAEPGDYQLVSMWVAPEARGTGAAHALVHAALDHARAAAARRLVLWVAWGNIRAEALYQAHGFKRTGQTGSFPPPRDTPELQLAIRL